MIRKMFRILAIIVALFNIMAFSEAKGMSEIRLSAFDDCEGEFNVTKKACRVIHNTCSIPNWESLLIDGQYGGFLRFPQKSMCPFNGFHCKHDQFTYFGWVKFYEYPKCGEVAAYVTSPKFDIHLLPNGHLRVNVRDRLSSKKFLKVESHLPVLLNEWYALVLQVDLSKGQNPIELLVNKKLYTESNTTNVEISRDPPPKSFLLGTDGHGGGFTKMEISYAYFADHVIDFDVAWEKLTRENFLTQDCSPKYNMVSTGPFQCYVFLYPNYRASYESHRKGCKSFGNYFGYEVARPLKISNLHIWEEFIAPKIEKVSSSFDYKFWATVDQDLLDENIFPLKTSEQENDTCTIMDTSNKPWTLTQTSCNNKHAKICELSRDCLANSPCQNDGLCQQTDDGAVCHCLEGTSGKFCEKGKPNHQMNEAQKCNNVY